MRLKNVKGAKEKVERSTYLILDPLKQKGNYQQIFKNDHPIHIEIGMGKGQFLIQSAKKYPNINFIGIEKFDSVLVRAIQKLEKEELPNLKIIKIDAIEINQMFDHEIETIYLNFSDPWPKNRHEHRRLSSSTFLQKYESIFKERKHIIMKTDNRHLFEYSIISFTNFGYKIEQLSLNLYKDNIMNNIPTEYETKFASLGDIIYQIEISKN